MHELAWMAQSLIHNGQHGAGVIEEIAGETHRILALRLDVVRGLR